jgi:hypothetical protein
MENAMACQTIAAAANTEVPAYLTLIKLGYAVDRIDQGGEELWTAKNGTLQLIAKSPLELLGLCLLSGERGPNWQARDDAIDEFLGRFYLSAEPGSSS